MDLATFLGMKHLQVVGQNFAGPVKNDYRLSPNNTDAYATNQEAGELLELSALHNQLLVGGQLVATGTGDNTVGALPTSTVRKPWLDPPDGSVSYDKGSGAVLDPVLGNTVTVLTQTTPEGYDGVITAFSWNFTGGGFVNYSGDIVVKLLRNGIPIKNYENITVEKGTIGIPRSISPIRIYSNDIITMTATHATNLLLNGQIVGSLQGYFYPSAS